VSLVGGDRRPPKQGQSYMCKCTMLRRSCSPVFALHQSVVGGRAAKRDAIPMVVGPHTSKCAASGDQTLEVINMRGLQIRSGGLIMAAVLVKPRNRVRLGTTICGHRDLLGEKAMSRESHTREWQRFQYGSSVHHRLPYHFVLRPRHMLTTPAPMFSGNEILYTYSKMDGHRSTVVLTSCPVSSSNNGRSIPSEAELLHGALGRVSSRGQTAQIREEGIRLADE
jgi:hypothetical protein